MSLPAVECLAEVKQLNPNADEKAADADLEEHGYHTRPVNIDLERVRRKIREANSQLRSVAAETDPCLVVLWTDMMWAPVYFSDENMASVLFGEFNYVTQTRELHLLGNRTLRRDANTTISAVCAMKYEEFVAFHNPFAKNPLEPQDLGPLIDRECWFDFPSPDGSGPSWTTRNRDAG